MRQALETTPKGSVRQSMRTALLAAAFFCAAIITAVQVLNLIAGTWVTRDSDGTERLALASLSVVEFQGIIPSPTDPDSYLVTMRLFHGAFGYEYPEASIAAIISSTPNLPADFVRIGEHLNLPPSSWACYRNRGKECTSPFYDAFGRGFHLDDMSTTLSTFSHAYALVFVALVILVEVLIAVRPSWLRCLCYFSWLKRVCPCPRGTRAEIEALPPAFWDRYRLWTWAFAPCVAVVPAIGLFLNGLILKEYVSVRRAGNVNARFGTGFLALQGLSLGAAFVAVGCVYVRRVLGRRESWLDQRGTAAPEDGFGVEVLRPKGYSDAEPEVQPAPARDLAVEDGPARPT
ncbi:hypothetical protein CSOJ01_13262 [Colletotrichum sojae]|uniref:Uncharacterized protein n=1 Tax=Colletotrichum sojae TaxID=2175907 RepID=A0A8H6MLK6_9PEZI|nr:hypothetical protein CSOJ01_13262 [Colletotrichum sojae]